MSEPIRMLMILFTTLLLTSPSQLTASRAPLSPPVTAGCSPPPGQTNLIRTSPGILSSPPPSTLFTAAAAAPPPPPPPPEILSSPPPPLSFRPPPSTLLTPPPKTLSTPPPPSNVNLVVVVNVTGNGYSAAGKPNWSSGKLIVVYLSWVLGVAACLVLLGDVAFVSWNCVKTQQFQRSTHFIPSVVIAVSAILVFVVSFICLHIVYT